MLLGSTSGIHPSAGEWLVKKLFSRDGMDFTFSEITLTGQLDRGKEFHNETRNLGQDSKRPITGLSQRMV
jgi:hypothetical protein